MMRSVFNLAITILLIGGIANAYDSKNGRIKIAVSEFESQNPEIGRQISSSILGKLGELKRFDVAEREQVSKILKEASFQMSGATSNGINELKLLSVDFLVVGSITKMEALNVGSSGNTYEPGFSASFRVIDVSTGSTIMGLALLSSDLSFAEKSGMLGSSSSEVESHAINYITNKVIESIKLYYAIETSITAQDGDYFKIDRGYEDGIKIGNTFDVINSEGFRKKFKGKIKIKETDPHIAIGKLIDGNASIGDKLKESESLKLGWGIYFDGYYSQLKYINQSKKENRAPVAGMNLGVDYPEIFGTNFGWRISAGGGISNSISYNEVAGGFFYNFWLKDDKIAMPIFIGISKQEQTIKSPNYLLAKFISDYPSDSISGTTNEKQDNLGLIPEIGIQYFFNSRISLTVAYNTFFAISRENRTLEWDGKTIDVPASYAYMNKNYDEIGRFNLRVKISFP